MDRPDYGRIKRIHIILTKSNPLRAAANISTDVFMSIDPEKLRQAQQAEFGPYFEHLCDPKKRLPSSLSRTSLSHYSQNGDLIYRPYLPGHLRKRSTFRDQLVILSTCIPMVLHACHGHAMSGGHLTYKHTFGNVRDRFWWPRFVWGTRSSILDWTPLLDCHVLKGFGIYMIGILGRLY